MDLPPRHLCDVVFSELKIEADTCLAKGHCETCEFVAESRKLKGDHPISLYLTAAVYRSPLYPLIQATGHESNAIVLMLIALSFGIKIGRAQATEELINLG